MNANRADFLELSQEILNRGAMLRFRARGSSMRPSILHGDILVVEPLNDAHLSIGDVVFYRRSDGALTAHRLVKVNGRKGRKVLVTKGDALDYFDQPVRPEQVLGKVTTVERDGYHIRLDSGVRKHANKIWAIISPMSRQLRPIVRPVWRLSRSLSPTTVFALCLSTLQGIPIYRQIAGLFRSGIETIEADEEDMHKIHACLNPGQPELPTSPGINFTYFVAKKGDRIVGSIELVRRTKKYHPYDGHWLTSLQVRPAYRGMGIGEKLSRIVVEKSLEEGAEGLYLMVREDNYRAIKLYHKLGFQLEVIPTLEEQLKKERHSLGFRNVVMYIPLAGNK